MAASEALRESRKELLKKPGKRTFHSIVGFEGDYQADIMFFKYSDSPKYKKLNDGYICILLVVEIPTRYAFAVPMKSKGDKEVVDAFEQIWEEIDQNGYPFLKLTTDKGKEFNNDLWDNKMRELNIKQLVKEPGDRYSLGIIDRLCRTLKTWIEDWQIENEDLSWHKCLKDIVEKYNKHEVSTMKASPNKLREYGKEFEEALQMRQVAGLPAIDKMHGFSIGDHVRIRLRPAEQPRESSKLAKASDSTTKGVDRYSNKVYVITDLDRFSFSLNDLEGKPAKRTYRHHELLKVKATSVDVPDIFAKVASEARQARRKKKEDL